MHSLCVHAFRHENVLEWFDNRAQSTQRGMGSLMVALVAFCALAITADADDVPGLIAKAAALREKVSSLESKVSTLESQLRELSEKNAAQASRIAEFITKGQVSVINTPEVKVVNSPKVLLADAISVAVGTVLRTGPTGLCRVTAVLGNGWVAAQPTAQNGILVGDPIKVNLNALSWF